RTGVVRDRRRESAQVAFGVPGSRTGDERDPGRQIETLVVDHLKHPGAVVADQLFAAAALDAVAHDAHRSVARAWRGIDAVVVALDIDVRQGQAGAAGELNGGASLRRRIRRDLSDLSALDDAREGRAAR